MKITTVCVLLSFALATTLSGAASADISSEVEHRYADSSGTRIHYAVAGSGPLVVMIHGFPDYWYSWRHQMNVLKDHFTVAAVDQRGYNLSDKPKGVASYAMAQPGQRHCRGDRRRETRARGRCRSRLGAAQSPGASP